MERYKLSKIIHAITSVMPCDHCPYPCKANVNSSLANCDGHWYEMLTAVAKEPRAIVIHEIMDFMEIKNG